jgi:hypothetical protein
MNCSPDTRSTGSAGGQAQIQMLQWLFYPVFMPLSKHPIVKNLDGISSEVCQYYRFAGYQNIKKTILLTSSPYNKKLSAPHMLSLQALEQEPKPKDFQTTPKQYRRIAGRVNLYPTFATARCPKDLNGQVTMLLARKQAYQNDRDQRWRYFKNQVAGWLAVSR